MARQWTPAALLAALVAALLCLMCAVTNAGSDRVLGGDSLSATCREISRYTGGYIERAGVVSAVRALYALCCVRGACWLRSPAACPSTRH